MHNTPGRLLKLPEFFKEVLGFEQLSLKNLHLCVETLIELHLRTLSVCTLVNLYVKAQQMDPPGTGNHIRALLTN